jgi:putative FmdB family regulatory protein
MPVYEYQCLECDKKFEALRPMSQIDAPIACPRCQAENARRAISVFAAISREAGGGSRMVASSAPSGGGCGGCSGGNCSACGH